MTEQEVGERMQTLELNEKISVGRKCPGGSPLKTGSMPEWVPGRPVVLRIGVVIAVALESSTSCVPNMLVMN